MPRPQQSNLRGQDVVHLQVRLPRELHERLVASAEANRRSINAEVLAILDRHLDTREKDR